MRRWIFKFTMILPISCLNNNPCNVESKQLLLQTTCNDNIILHIIDYFHVQKLQLLLVGVQWLSVSQYMCINVQSIPSENLQLVEQFLFIEMNEAWRQRHESIKKWMKASITLALGYLLQIPVILSVLETGKQYGLKNSKQLQFYYSI